MQQEIKKEQDTPGMFDSPILPLLYRLAIPIAAGMLLFFLYNLIDSFWVSIIDLKDPSYVGGLGIIFPILFFAIAISNGLTVGTSSLVARSIGRKNYYIVNQTLESGLVLAGGLSLFLLLPVYIAGKDIVRLLGAQGQYSVHALEYLYAIIPAGAFMFIGSILSGFLQGEGAVRMVMISVLLGTGANFLLDPVFIFLFNLKVAGAGLATTIAQAITCVALILTVIKKKAKIQTKLKWTHIRLSNIREILKIGFPVCGGMIIMAIASMITNHVVVNLSQPAITSFSICVRIEQLAYIPINAIGAALIIIVGQNFGREKYLRIREVWKRSIFTTIFIVLTLGTLLFLLAPFIYSFFSKVPDIVNLCIIHTRIEIFSLLFLLFTVFSGSFFQGMGRALPAFTLYLAQFLIFTVPAVYIFVYGFNLGIYGVMFGYVAGNVLSAILGFLWLSVILAKLQNRPAVGNAGCKEETYPATLHS